jgi:hypothetical protein
VQHPQWCEPALCKAGTSATGGHRSAPATVQTPEGKTAARLWLEQQPGCPVRIAPAGDSYPPLLDDVTAREVAALYERMADAVVAANGGL